jgi:hypothetical protein
MRTRRRIAFFRLKTRYPSTFLRILPDFLIIGAQRSGTTSMYKYLSAHPDLAGSLRKEVEYFTQYFDRGEFWYRAHFATSLSPKLHKLMTGHPKLSFEASPNYLFFPPAAERAASAVPNASAIAILRNPIDRAYSHYLHNRRLGLEDLSFHGALLKEPERLSTGRSVHMLRFSYVQRGMYAAQLDRWFNHFGRDRLKVISYDDFINAPGQVMEEICGFLNVRSWTPKTFANFSYPTGGAPSHEPMMPQSRSYLRSLYKDEVQKLYSLIQRDLEWSI